MVPETTPNPEGEIERLFRDWAHLEVSDDLDTWLDAIADDAVLQPPDEPPVEGKAAIRNYARGFFQLPLVKMEPGSMRIHVDGDLACIYGPLRMGLDGDVGVVEQTLKCMAVWRKQAGRWKLAANSWSANGPT